MKIKLMTGLLFLLALPAHAATILECERLVDTLDGKVLKDREVRIEGDRIVEVGRSVEAAPEDERIALGTCLPGLMDMHVHLDMQMSPEAYIKRFQANPADHALMAAHYASKTLQEVGATLMAALPAPAFGVAYGGDEFVMVLPGFDKQQALEIARFDLVRRVVVHPRGVYHRRNDHLGCHHIAPGLVHHVHRAEIGQALVGLVRGAAAGDGVPRLLPGLLRIRIGQ